MSVVNSFDIFDTVLVRSVGSPLGSFLLLGNKLKHLGALDGSAESFARARADAEVRAFRNAGGLDSSVNLENIYTELGFALRIPRSRWEGWLQHELDMETEILQVSTQAKEIVAQCRNRKEQVLYASDMYLDSSFIKEILKKHGLYQDDDRLYVSSEHQKSKQELSLYTHIIEKENLTKSKIIHYGNHEWSDIRAPKLLGIKTRPFRQGNLNRYERILESGIWDSEGLSSVMAGASRLARLTMKTNNKQETILRDNTVSVAAPILVHFTLWVLNRAKKLGLKRLFFLSRDGQVLLEIAQRLIKKMDMDCELHYLYGSRQAWLLPSLTYIDDERLSLIFSKKYDVTFLSPRILLARFFLSPEDVKHILNKINLTENHWDQNLTSTQKDQLRTLILEDDEFKAIILQQAEQRRQVMLKYLEQEGVREGDFGLVDLGTGSTLHSAISSVLDTVGLKPPKSFYLGLRPGVTEDRFGLPETYANNALLGIGFDFPRLVTFLEMICSADHGSVLTYQQVGDRVEPVLTDEVNHAVLGWGYSIVRESIQCFSEQILLHPDYVKIESDMRPVLERLLTEFWSNLTPEEAKVWGKFPMEDGWGEQASVNPLARPYSFGLLLLVLRGKIDIRRHWWHTAAIKMSSYPLRTSYSLLTRFAEPRKSIRFAKVIRRRLQNMSLAYIRSK